MSEHLLFLHNHIVPTTDNETHNIYLKSKCDIFHLTSHCKEGMLNLYKLHSYNFLLFREVESEGSVKPSNPNRLYALEGANLSE